MEYRIEHDSMGEVKVPADKYWAAQTERSHENFLIGVGIETMPREITKAFGYLKKAAAMANHALKPEKMTDEKVLAVKLAFKAGGYKQEIKAINQDEKAPIFDVSHLGIIGDIYEIIPKLTEKIKAMKNEDAQKVAQMAK